jgi:K+-transporting ATPase ATPase C chain
MKKHIFISVKMLILFTLLTGIIYPASVTMIDNLLFKDKANGSIIKKNGLVIGSSLIGQAFDSSAYFWSRPSATGYNTLPSGGSNLCLSNDGLRQLITEREQGFLSSNNLMSGTYVPSEMIFSSASGLDPHISPEAAFLQVDRIVETREFSVSQRMQLENLLAKLIEEPQFHLFGQERINVFILNLELDKIH